MKELIEIARLRAEGARRLDLIAREDGADSVLYRRCREVWSERELDADLSVISGDWKNAIAVLQRGLDVLVHGPAVLKKDGLSPEDAFALLSAV